MAFSYPGIALAEGRRPREDAMNIAEAEAVVVKGRFRGSPKTASGGYIAGLLGQHLDGPARVSLDASIPVDHAFGVERLADGRVGLSHGAAGLAHAGPAVLHPPPPPPPPVAAAPSGSPREPRFSPH